MIPAARPQLRVEAQAGEGPGRHVLLLRALELVGQAASAGQQPADAPAGSPCAVAEQLLRALQAAAPRPPTYGTTSRWPGRGVQLRGPEGPSNDAGPAGPLAGVRGGGMWSCELRGWRSELRPEEGPSASVLPHCCPAAGSPGERAASSEAPQQPGSPASPPDMSQLSDWRSQAAAQLEGGRAGAGDRPASWGPAPPPAAAVGPWPAGPHAGARDAGTARPLARAESPRLTRALGHPAVALQPLSGSGLAGWRAEGGAEAHPPFFAPAPPPALRRTAVQLEDARRWTEPLAAAARENGSGAVPGLQGLQSLDARLRELEAAAGAAAEAARPGWGPAAARPLPGSGAPPAPSPPSCPPCPEPEDALLRSAALPALWLLAGLGLRREVALGLAALEGEAEALGGEAGPAPAGLPVGPQRLRLVSLLPRHARLGADLAGARLRGGARHGSTLPRGAPPCCPPADYGPALPDALQTPAARLHRSHAPLARCALRTPPPRARRCTTPRQGPTPTPSCPWPAAAARRAPLAASAPW